MSLTCPDGHVRFEHYTPTHKLARILRVGAYLFSALNTQYFQWMYIPFNWTSGLTGQYTHGPLPMLQRGWTLYGCLTNGIKASFGDYLKEKYLPEYKPKSCYMYFQILTLFPNFLHKYQNLLWIISEGNMSMRGLKSYFMSWTSIIHI